MSGTKRRIDPGVIQQLLEQPQRFGFFQALRLIEQGYVREGHRAEEIVPRRVRFRNTLSLDFPASEIEALQPVEADDAMPAEGGESGPLPAQLWLTPAFMGLLGTNGALPLHYTEEIGRREIYQRDRAARAFLDIFTTRAVALHYAAWKKYRLPLQYEIDRRERFLPLVLSLAGVGLPGLRERLSDGRADLFDQAIAHHAGGISQRPVSAAYLQQLLSAYFGLAVRVEQFVGAWYTVPAAQRTRLGSASAVLGATALAGDRLWQRDLRLRLWFGPLDRDDFDQLLPGGHAAQVLGKWLALLTGVSFEYEARLILKAEHVRGVRLKDGGARLGWDSYLCSRPSDVPRADAGYLVPAPH